MEEDGEGLGLVVGSGNNGCCRVAGDTVVTVDGILDAGGGVLPLPVGLVSFEDAVGPAAVEEFSDSIDQCQGPALLGFEAFLLVKRWVVVDS